MNRTGLILALAAAAVFGLVFGLRPEFDLAIARPFHAFVRDGNTFGARIYPPAMILRDTMLWVVTAAAALPALALLWKLVVPVRSLLVPARAILFLLLTMAAGPGVLTNVILKDHWGRSRPIDVKQFGGEETFVPWWSLRGDCPNNCSFVSGDVSGAYWLTAPAALAPPSWRPLAYAGAVTFGLVMSGLRVAAGGHFASDTIFAGVFTFLIVWLGYALIYRWPRTRLSEAKLEAGIERFAMPGYRLFAGLFGAKRKPARRPARAPHRARRNIARPRPKRKTPAR